MQARKLSCKAKIHELHAASQTLRAATYKTQATSHALLANSHQLCAQSFAIQASRQSILQLNYELRQQHHTLQTELHLDCAKSCQLKFLESQMKALAHRTLAQHLHTTIRQMNLVESLDR